MSTDVQCCSCFFHEAFIKVPKVSISESSLKFRKSFCPTFTGFVMWIGMGNLSGSLCDLYVSVCLPVFTVVSWGRNGLSLLYFCLAYNEKLVQGEAISLSCFFMLLISNRFGSLGFM